MRMPGMTFDRPPSATPPASADPPKRVLVIALIVMVVLAALAATALVLVLLGRESPAAGVDPSPTPTERPTQSPEPTPSPTADPTPSPSPEPTPQIEPTDGLTHLDYGARATVAVDRLRVRYFPSTEYDVATVITAGQEMLILSGPITAEDYEWYLIELPNPGEGRTTYDGLGGRRAGGCRQPGRCVADPHRTVELSARGG